MEKDKLQALCDAIQTIFDQDNISISIFTDRLPNGYLKRIHDILPKEYFWPDTPKNLSRTIRDNKSDILNILKLETTATTEQFQMDIIEHSEKNQVSEHSEKNHSERSENIICSENITRSEVISIMSDMLEQALSNRSESIQNIQNALELPPTQKIMGKSGRKKSDRAWVKLSTSVNSRLNDLFEAECKTQRLSRAQLLDAILWEHYGKPDLD